MIEIEKESQVNICNSDYKKYEETYETKTKNFQRTYEDKIKELDEMQLEITPKIAAIVHISLMFFTLLFVLAIVGAVFLVRRYGFVILLAVILIATLFLGMSYFVGYLILEEEKLKQGRLTVEKWQRIAKAVVLEEMKLFKMDFQEQFLLMNEPANNYDNEEAMHMNEEVKPRKRSKILGVLLAPFGGFRKRRKLKKRMKETQESESNSIDIELLNKQNIAEVV